MTGYRDAATASYLDRGADDVRLSASHGIATIECWVGGELQDSCMLSIEGLRSLGALIDPFRPAGVDDD